MECDIIQVGPQALADGAETQARGGRSGEMVITALHGRYYEQTYRGNLFTATNQAAQAVSVALTTTYTGLCISNPIGSNRNLVILSAAFALSVAPAAIASIHLIAGYSGTSPVVHTTPLASPGVQNCLIGSQSKATGLADSAATIVNPGYLMPLMGGFTAAALPSSPVAFVDLSGQFVVPPGGWIAIGALTAVTGFGGFTWEEVAV